MNIEKMYEEFETEIIETAYCMHDFFNETEYYICRKCGQIQNKQSVSYSDNCYFTKVMFYKRINYLYEIILNINNCD